MSFKKLIADGSEISEDTTKVPCADSITVLVSQLVQDRNSASRKVDRLVTFSSANIEVGELDENSSQQQCRPSPLELSKLVPVENQVSQVNADRKVLGTHSKYSNVRAEGPMSSSSTPSLFTVNGVIGGHLVTALIDSGCDVECVLSIHCAERLGLARSPSLLKAERWDGSLSPLEVVKQPLTLNLGGQLDCEGLTPYCAESLPFDLILGLEWLRKYNPRINWKSDTLLVYDNSQRRCVHISAQKSSMHVPNYVITPKQLKRSARKGATVFLVQLHHVGMRGPTRESASVGHTTGMGPSGTSSTGSAEEEIPSALQFLLEQYTDVFPDELPNGLPPERSVKLNIDLLPGTKPVKRPIYKLSIDELKEVKKQVDELLEKGFIRPSTSPWSSSILFVPKKDGGLRMCVDYRALNKATVRNNYPLPRIDEVWDQIGGSRYFSSLDLRSGYNQIRIAEDDTYKTCFRTRYGAYEFLVVPFGLAGAPPIFQSLMNEVLRPYLDKFCLVYLDDILVYSKTKNEHVEHLRIILTKLREHQLYCKLSKCEFLRSSLTYLGHHISFEGIGVEERKVNAIRCWERPKNLVNLQSFLGLCNYYRKFVRNFSSIAAPLTNLTKKSVTFEWTSVQETAFTQLKEALMNTPILRNADNSLPFEVQTDASETGIGAVLQQKSEDGILPVAYMSRKLNAAEQNYSVHERELLAVVDSLREWRSYLLGHRFIVKTDHRPLQHLQTQPQLSRRQARWVIFLQEYDFDWEYVTGPSNRAADSLSRQNFPPVHATWDNLHDIAKSVPTDDAIRLNTHMIVESMDVTDLASQYSSDPEFKDSFQNPQPPFRRRDGRLYNGNLLCLPMGELRDTVLHDHHDAVASGHRGIAKTIASISRSYYWSSLGKDVTEYVRSCDACQRAKAVRQSRSGLLRPFPPPQRKWEVISMDFVFDLPLTSHGKNGIAVVVDKLSRQAHFLALTPNFDAIDLAHLYLHEVYRHHGLPRILISDRDVRFTSLFWTSLMKRLGVRLNLSTAYHPETDGQTERTIGTFEDMIRPYVCYLQNDWDQYLDQLEFAYNNSEHASLGQTPFMVTYGQHPTTLDDVLTSPPPTMLEPPAVQDLLDATERARHLAHHSVTQMNARMAATANRSRREVTFQVHDLVLLSTRHLRFPLGSTRVKKFASRWIGPFKVLASVADGRAYKLDLPGTMPLHPTFHVSLLKPYVPNTHPSRLQVPPTSDLFADGHEEWEVECILSHRWRGSQLHYLVSWRGFAEHENSWLPETNLSNSPDILAAYWAGLGGRPPGPPLPGSRKARGRASS
jgi:transposase InsO family protein